MFLFFINIEILFVILTIVLNVLLGVLRAKGIEECEFEVTASEWFRLSKLRHEQENKKLPDEILEA